MTTVIPESVNLHRAWPAGAYGDALLWPVNLVRDLPRRLGRLLGVLSSPPAPGQGGPSGAWLHALLSYLFDLAGGPEIAEFFLRLATRTRPLSAGEIAAASAVLGPKAIRFGDVRIAQGGLLRPAFRANKGRAFATWHTINLPDGREEDLSLLVHELTHVFQYERVGTVYIGQGLWVQRKHGRQAYHYDGPSGLTAAWAAGKRYSDYNREQQGQIAQDYCALMRAGRDTVAYEPYIAQLQAGAL